jgi:hypothetical protein
VLAEKRAEARTTKAECIFQTIAQAAIIAFHFLFAESLV